MNEMEKDKKTCYLAEELIALRKQGIDLNLLFAGERQSTGVEPSPPYSTPVYPLGECPAMFIIEKLLLQCKNCPCVWQKK